MKMRTLIFLLITSMCCMSCSASRDGCEISYYDNQKVTQVPLGNSKEFDRLVKELIDGIDDCYHAIVDEDVIEATKQKKCIEIIFPDVIETTTREGKSIKFRKLLIPVNAFPDNSIVFFCGDRTYFTPPLVNSQGAQGVKRMKELCETNLN
ncbi:MAG: hypothetical protein IKZ92_07050 [Muribaculaceae bacterium]|nr:hypothetical protein [Muribaculaceae bacterium]